MTRPFIPCGDYYREPVETSPIERPLTNAEWRAIAGINALNARINAKREREAMGRAA